VALATIVGSNFFRVEAAREYPTNLIPANAIRPRGPGMVPGTSAP
jgi:hypothetical protein